MLSAGLGLTKAETRRLNAKPVWRKSPRSFVPSAKLQSGKAKKRKGRVQEVRTAKR